MRFGGDFHPPVALAATSGYSPTSAARRTKSATTLLVGPREPRSELQNAWASLYPCDQVPPSDFGRMWSSVGKFSSVRLEALRNGCGTVRPQRWQLPRALSEVCEGQIAAEDQVERPRGHRRPAACSPNRMTRGDQRTRQFF